MPINTQAASSIITCPSCAHQFEASAAMEQSIREQIEAEFNQKKTEYNQKIKDQRQKQEEDFRKRDVELQQQIAKLEQARAAQDAEIKKKVDEECSRTKITLEKQLKEEAESNYGEKLRYLEEQKLRTERELKESKEKEVELMRLKDQYRKREEELELEKQKALTAERGRMQEEWRKAEAERSRLNQEENAVRVQGLEKQLDDQKKLIEEMKRKAEQGSMQLQGDAKEIVIEEILGELFPFDTISKSRKGVEETDLTHHVFNDFRHPCGKIVYEIKNTKAWQEPWITKLKLDMRNGSAEAAVIVSKTLPKDCTGFTNKDGIWICNHDTVRIVSVLLRDSLIKVYEANRLLDNVSDKKERLYKYMTSTEFKQKWDAIIEVYTTMQKHLAKEKVSAQKQFSERAKQLDVMLTNTVGFIGDIKGLGGLEMMDVKLLEESEEA